MELLLLGGTAFLGRAIAAAARADHIGVTCLARGTAAVPEGVRFVRADRDHEGAYDEVSGRSWDAVVDLTRRPGHARRAVRDLDAIHWIFVSSGNVYAHFDRPEQDERAPLVPALEGEAMADPSEYGAAKVACEEAVRSRRSFTIIRAGLIGGDGDATGRSGYYPWRFAHPTGDDVLVPPDLELPAAFIDVADLADWIVQCARRRVQGVYNATGPTTTLGDVLATAREVAGSAAVPRPVPAEVLDAAGVAEWMGTPSLPLWLQDEEWRWFPTLDTTAARAAGLRTRPLAETLAAALRYEERRDPDTPRGAGLDDEQERDLRRRLDKLEVAATRG